MFCQSLAYAQQAENSHPQSEGPFCCTALGGSGLGVLGRLRAVHCSTKKFVATQRASGLEFEENPPTFHEIRSLAGRLCEKEKGTEFTQKLLGHKSEKMTGKYLDARGKEYVML